MEVRQQAASGKAAAVRAVGSSRITGIHFFLWLDDCTLYDFSIDGEMRFNPKQINETRFSTTPAILYFCCFDHDGRLYSRPIEIHHC